jgi:DNA primase
VVLFCNSRKIPKEKQKQLYFIDNIRNIVQLNDKYKESIQGEEPRLVLPFYDNDGQLSGVTCRALRGETLRYITVKVKDGVPLLFGIDSVNRSKPIYVVEGPIDSLFLDNAIAVGGTSFGKLNEIGLDKDKLIVVFDNQPRNKEVCKLIEKNIEVGFNVVLWPQTIAEKDINEMVMAGHNVKKIIKDNTFSGLTAKMKFIGWKRC